MATIRLDFTMHSALRRAIERADIQAVNVAIEHGADIEEADMHGDPGLPLRTACFKGHASIVETLIKHGANINQTDRWGNTPLHLAIINQNHEAIHSLLKNGSNPNIRNNYGLSALDKASTSPSILDFMKQYSESKRNIPKFRVKLKLQ